MGTLQTFFIGGLGATIMALFTSISQFIVNRYAPKIADRVDKLHTHFKKNGNDNESKRLDSGKKD
jgi:hypothetical protein